MHGRSTSSNGRGQRRRGRIRRLTALLGAAAVAIASLVALPGIAQAAGPNPDIVVGDVTLAPGGSQATVGDTLTVAGTWDATHAHPQTGDTFTIGLPSELAFTEAMPFRLFGEGGVVWGDCLTDPATGVATCTLTDAVEENPELVQGTFQFDVEAVESTTEEDVTFVLNGAQVAVPLPGGGGIDDGLEPPAPWSKSGVINADHWSITWTIDLPGDRLQGHGSVGIAETLGAGHQLCDPVQLSVAAIKGGSATPVAGIASTIAGADAQHFTIALTEPTAGWDAKATYRVTYTTCTPDERIDPVGTEYTNEATIDIWGESSGVIGVTQDWDHRGTIAKSGSVLGGADRNGTIAWTVTVDGDRLAGQDELAFAERLSGAHALCADTIDGIRVIERYGPSAERERDVTGDLEVTTNGSTSTTFDTTISIRSGSTFEFRQNPYVYLIAYSTCATTDGLPEGGTVFGNTASVDGVETSGTATVPGRTDTKNGAINTGKVTLDGVEHMPQTTMSWSITVPGQNLVDVDSDLVVTDELSATQAVCEGSGGSIAARLGLTVRAIDQVSGGGLASVDLTGGVGAALAGNRITLTIPRPALPQPDGSTATGFGREYQYVIAYTTCTASGGMDAPGTVYGNGAVINGKSYSRSFTQNNNGSGTGQGVSRGSIAVVKDLADTPGAAFVPADTVFTVHAKEIDPSGTVQNEFDLAVPLDGEPVSGVNARGTGWKVELSEPTLPRIPGIVFGDPVFAASEGVVVGDGGRTATATITPATNVRVALTNRALLGAVTVVKQVDGPAAGAVDPDREYTVTARIDVSDLDGDVPAQSDRVFALTAGTPFVLDDLPIGSTVTFSEAVPADDDVLTWSAASFDPESLVVTEADASVARTVTVTNHVRRTVGTFSLAKTVTGDEASNPAVPDEVTVTAVWDEEGTPGRTTLTLPTDGTPVPLGESLLVGTEVTLTETPLSDRSGIAWGAPVWSGTGVTIDGPSAVVRIGRDPAAAVALENHAATSTGGISIVKGVAGEAASEVATGTAFPVTASWLDAQDVLHTKELRITASAPTPLGEALPAGTVVTISEHDRPQIDTVRWGAIVIAGDAVADRGDGVATVTVSDQQGETTLVTVTNEADWAPGTLSVAKAVTGISLDHPGVPDAVAVTASWTDADGAPQARELSAPTDGTPVPLGVELPHGTEVTLTETALPLAAGFTWDAPVWSGERVASGGDGSAVVTVGAADVAAVTLTNHATPVLGSVVLGKRLSGQGASGIAVGTAFPIVLTWTDLQGVAREREVTVTAGGRTVVPDLPAAVEIRLSEQAVDLPDALRWTGATWSAADDAVTVQPDGRSEAIVTLDGSGSHELIVTNAYATDPVLAVTGLDGALTLGIGAVAVALLIGGAVLLIVRRRRAA